MSECNETLRELYLYLDGELTDSDRVHIQQHLDDCSPCLEAFDFEAELRLVVRNRCVDQVPESGQNATHIGYPEPNRACWN